MMTIGRLSEQSGVKVPTIRYYEETGLMPEPERTEGNQRRYVQAHLDRLTFIRHARELGFSVDAVHELLSLQADPDAPCAAADEIAERRLDDIRFRIEKLKRLEQELLRITQPHDSETVRDCNVLHALSDHALCESEH
ncbi:helix-turn-helix domain-containing protein [Rhizobium sp. L1K21]|uniref:MerR family transcriptional regulator n=1 Tax=Rhizobium sp. L1K21 TaxID=2954933 RepID=UPI0020927A19|nr:helix-turn-helix domain-containing protein [Rhizobium sp. L1K21]MCO6185684.1 helix-turn-helix domain-containing protein [Rhizobium sp. L1K21]